MSEKKCDTCRHQDDFWVCDTCIHDESMKDSYISREGLIERLGRNLAACNPGTFSEACYKDAIETVRNAPAADVAQVRHGRSLRTWIDEYYGEWTECSVCGWDNPANAQYCNGCGAKMDGSGGNG